MGERKDLVQGVDARVKPTPYLALVGQCCMHLPVKDKVRETTQWRCSFRVHINTENEVRTRFGCNLYPTSEPQKLFAMAASRFQSLIDERIYLFRGIFESCGKVSCGFEVPSIRHGNATRRAPARRDFPRKDHGI